MIYSGKRIVCHRNMMLVLILLKPATFLVLAQQIKTVKTDEKLTFYNTFILVHHLVFSTVLVKIQFAV